MKLKIGTIKKKEVKKENYADEYSDEELETMSKEANEPKDFDLEETEEIPKEVVEETEADIKKAMNDVVIFDEVGISMRYVYKFTELYPKKKIVYHNFITKQFLEWYIKKAKLPLLKKLFITDSEYVNPEQQEELDKMIGKRLQKETNDFIEKEATKQLKDMGFNFEVSNAELIHDEIDEKAQKNREHERLDSTNIVLGTEEQIKAYEFLLNEKWLPTDRAKGIEQLDAILEEQMRMEECDLDQAFKNILENFGLQSKFSIESKLKKSEPKEVEKKKRPSNAEVSKELDRSIKRFHHIKFLYELMGSDKMELVKDLSDEEIKHIEKIDELLYSATTKTTESMDSFLKEGK